MVFASLLPIVYSDRLEKWKCRGKPHPRNVRLCLKGFVLQAASVLLTSTKPIFNLRKSSALCMCSKLEGCVW